MRVVYQAEHLIDAHLVRGRLQAEGIRAHVLGEWLTGGLGELPVQGLLAVGVDDADAAAALALLETWRDESVDAAGEAQGEAEDALGEDAPDLPGDAAFLA